MLGELDTYSLIDFFPFSKEVYLRLFGLQNEAWWPAQFIFLFLALLVFAIAVAPVPWAKKVPARWRSAVSGAFLAVSFTCVAVTFFLGRYADLNWAAPYFGWVFIAQAVLFALVGALGKLEVAGRADGARGICFWSGCLWVMLALFGYPAMAFAGFGVGGFGRGWKTAELVGLAPDPTVVLAVGMIMLLKKPRLWLLVVPAAWSAAAGLTALALELSSGFITVSLVFLGAGIASFQRFFGAPARVAPEGGA